VRERDRRRQSGALETLREGERERVCVCKREKDRARARERASVCVRERDSERARERAKERKR